MNAWRQRAHGGVCGGSNLFRGLRSAIRKRESRAGGLRVRQLLQETDGSREDCGGKTPLWPGPDVLVLHSLCCCQGTARRSIDVPERYNLLALHLAPGSGMPEATGDSSIASVLPVVRQFTNSRSDPGPFQLKGAPTPADGTPEMYGARRTVLDKLLVDAAAEAGVEVAEGFTVRGLTSSDGRVTGIRGHRRNRPDVEEHARIVVGAAVGASEYNVRPAMTCVYYSYWRDVPPHLVPIRPRQRRVLITTPTNDGLLIAIVVFPIEEFETVKTDIDRHFIAAMDLAPELAGLLRAGKRVERYFGTADMENFFRKPFGDGWALAGDAGYHKDPCTAQDICDSFRSVEWLADAIHAGLSGSQPLGDALAGYRRVRDQHFLPMYDFTYGLAQLAPPPPEIQALHAALRNNQAETNRFFGTLAGLFRFLSTTRPRTRVELFGRLRRRAFESLALSAHPLPRIHNGIVARRDSSLRPQPDCEDSAGAPPSCSGDGVKCLPNTTVRPFASRPFGADLAAKEQDPASKRQKQVKRSWFRNRRASQASVGVSVLRGKAALNPEIRRIPAIESGDAVPRETPLAERLSVGIERKRPGSGIQRKLL